MQTIKTAAIVVLMLTVLYGGYVSLTTPPEPLPDEIGDILVIEESGIGDFDSPNSLAAGLELGEPPAGVLRPDAGDNAPESGEQIAGGQTAGGIRVDSGTSAPATAMAPPLPAPMSAQAIERNQAKPAGAASATTYGGSFADLPAKRTTSAELASAPMPAAKKLPSVDSPAPQLTPRPASSYASTDSEFALPDPSDAQANFDPGRGAPFQSSGGNVADADNQYRLSDRSDAAEPGMALQNVGQSPASGSAASSGQNAAPGQAGSPENIGLTNAFATADAMYGKGQLKEALATLSVFYGMPNLNETQTAQLLSRLDPLAREVIYSKRHLLEQPHRVGASETLIQIAGQYDIPWQLLANINGVDDPVTVLPGTELKIIRGPFRAEVDLTGKQLTMFLGDLYAGRFDIEVGNDPKPMPGTFTVQEKQTAHVYYAPSGAAVQPGSPENPYGGMWLDLGGQVCLHGSPNTVEPTDAGCISVANDYADDVFAILSQGSSVTIRR